MHVYCMKECSIRFNPLTRKSDQHLISPYRIINESIIKITRIMSDQHLISPYRIINESIIKITRMTNKYWSP